MAQSLTTDAALPQNAAVLSSMESGAFQKASAKKKSPNTPESALSEWPLGFFEETYGSLLKANQTMQRKD